MFKDTRKQYKAAANLSPIFIASYQKRNLLVHFSTGENKYAYNERIDRNSLLAGKFSCINLPDVLNYY